MNVTFRVGDGFLSSLFYSEGGGLERTVRMLVVVSHRNDRVSVLGLTEEGDAAEVLA